MPEDGEQRPEDIGDSLLASEQSNPAVATDKPAPEPACAAASTAAEGLRQSLYAMATAPTAGIGTPTRAPSPVVSSTLAPTHHALWASPAQPFPKKLCGRCDVTGSNFCYCGAMTLLAIAFSVQRTRQGAPPWIRTPEPHRSHRVFLALPFFRFEIRLLTPACTCPHRATSA